MPKSSGSFKPGQTGNPAGRPSIAKALATNGTTTTEVLAKLTKKALRWLDKGNEKQQEFAFTWLSQHTVGKPREHFDVHMSGVSESDLEMLAAVRMTPQERRLALAAEIVISDSQDATAEVGD